MSVPMMRAAWYDRKGAANEVLTVGELPRPVPGTDEVLIRLDFSGVVPGDTKKRAGAFSMTMPFPRVIPLERIVEAHDLISDGVTGSVAVRIRES